MTLTKARITEDLEKKLGFSKKQSIDVVETLLEIIKRTLESNEDVLISGFGRFCVKEKRARKGRNPATGDPMMLRARRVVTFKYSGCLKEKLNRIHDERKWKPRK